MEMKENAVELLNLGQRIKHERILKGYKQNAFAEMVGISATHLSSVENGRKELSACKLKNIARVLGVSIDSLMSDEKVIQSDYLWQEEVITHFNEVDEADRDMVIQATNYLLHLIKIREKENKGN